MVFDFFEFLIRLMCGRVGLILFGGLMELVKIFLFGEWFGLVRWMDFGNLGWSGKWTWKGKVPERKLTVAGLVATDRPGHCWAGRRRTKGVSPTCQKLIFFFEFFFSIFFFTIQETET